MIKERAETDQFALEIRFEIKNPDPNVDITFYENSIKSIVNLIAGGLCSGELFQFFMKELVKVSKNMLSAIQTEEALKGE